MALPRPLPASSTSILLRGCVPALAALASTVAAAELAVPAPVTPPAPAGDEVVTVSATKQSEELHRVPASIALFDDEAIRGRGAFGLTSLWPLTPNVVQASDRPNGHLIVRGIGSGEEPRTGGEENPTRGGHPAVGLYLDGLPVEATRGLAAFDDLLDVERVELLKGPQGTLYGRNAMGGMVDVRTRDPGLQGQIDGRVFYGSDNELRLSAAGGGPVAGGLGARLAVGYSRSDGSLGNATTGADDTANWERLQARGKVVWRASENLDLRLTVSGVRYEGSTDYWVPYADRESRTTRTNNPGEQELLGATAAVQADWYAGADDRLTVVAGVAKADDDVTYDGDRSAADAANIVGHNHTLTNSVEVRWTHTASDPLRWLAGVFAEDERVDYDADTTFSDQVALGFPYYQVIGFPQVIDKDSEAASRSAALFAEATWRIDPRWELTGGARLAFERTQFDWQQVMTNVPFGTFPNHIVVPQVNEAHADDRDEMVVLPKAALAHHLDDDRTLYASVVRGYRAGGFNSNASSATSARIVYDPEFSWNYELGLRSRWFERCLAFDLTGFYIDRRDQQVLTNVSAFDVAWVNAARSHVVGGEAALAWRDPSGLGLWAAGGLQRSEFDQRTDQFSGFDYEGLEYAHVPEWTWNLGASYQHACGAFGRVDWHGHSWTWVDDRNTERADPVALLDARVGYARDWWMLALVGRNLTDETDVLNSIFLPGDTVLTTDATYVRLGPPRSFGVEASARW
jgi:iron complex outermembrane receptor protein